MSTNEWFWFPLTTTRRTEYYTDNWSNKFTIHLSNLITVKYLSLKLQFTKDAQILLPLNQCTHGHVRSWTVASFQRSLRQLGMVLHTSKCVGEVFLPSQLGLNTLEVLSVPTDKNLKHWDRANVGVVMKHFYVFGCGDLTSEVCPRILGTSHIVKLWRRLPTKWVFLNGTTMRTETSSPSLLRNLLAPSSECKTGG